jgi:hypothetical protein
LQRCSCVGISELVAELLQASALSNAVMRWFEHRLERGVGMSESVGCSDHWSRSYMQQDSAVLLR